MLLPPLEVLTRAKHDLVDITATVRAALRKAGGHGCVPPHPRPLPRSIAGGNLGREARSMAEGARAEEPRREDAPRPAGRGLVPWAALRAWSLAVFTAWIAVPFIAAGTLRWWPGWAHLPRG